MIHAARVLAATAAYVYVLLSSGGVSVYRTDGAAPVRGILIPGLASAVACDRHGNLYVANSTLNSVDEYTPGGTRHLRVIVGSLEAPAALAFDARDDFMYVANTAGNSVAIYSPGASRPSELIARDVAAPKALALDSHGFLYVLGDRVSVFSGRDYRREYAVRDLSSPGSLAVDAKRTLYVGNLGNSTVTEYQLFSNTSERVIRTGISAPEALALDSAGSLYVANATAGSAAKGWISVFAPAATSPQRIIHSGSDLPTGLAFDAAGDLFVTNVSNNNAGSLTVYPPNGSVPLRRITQGVDGPLALTICPM